MLAAIITLGAAQAITITPFQAVRPNPRFDVKCELRDLESRATYKIAFSQYGGVYEKRAGDAFGARGPRYIKFERDDLGIFADQTIELVGNYSDWYSDGPIDLNSKIGRGGLTLFKTKPAGALANPGRVAVVARGGRYDRTGDNPASLTEFLLVGSCNVSWKEQVS